MRGCIQQGGGKLVGCSQKTGPWRKRLERLTATHWPLTLLAIAVYLLTMDRSASWWDCGEFISTSWLLEVGHPPGAPFYQLVAHCMMLLSFGNPMLVAPLSNALSAICGGFTVGLLYLTILELNTKHLALSTRIGAAVGAMCYLFCDTAWFSAVESEVYSMAMLCCALDVYLMLRWRRTANGRLLPLIALLLGLGVCVHLMTLLVAPALLLIYIKALKSFKPARTLKVVAVCLPLFLLGLTPYAIIPIRAAANPPINEGRPATAESFHRYLQREQYAKAPLYPRMWRERDANNWKEWTLGLEGVPSNVVYYFGYQLTYMYGRYLMYNFIGRENLKWRFVVLFIIPALLGAYGLWRHRRHDREGYWTVMLLFLFGGVILNLYLNHPCYEPRERDYAYVLSFYAFAVWIGIGAAECLGHRRWVTALVLLAPLLLAVGNWSDHDRHNCHSVHDISMAHLQSCDKDAILITLGDNDTFPLWYLQQVERQRTDIDIYNINLTGFGRTMEIIDGERREGGRPVYVSYYFLQRYGNLFPNLLRCEGYCWRLLLKPPDGQLDDTEPLQRHLRDSIRFNITRHEYLPSVSRNFLKMRDTYWTTANAGSR